MDPSLGNAAHAALLTTISVSQDCIDFSLLSEAILEVVSLLL